MADAAEAKHAPLPSESPVKASIARNAAQEAALRRSRNQQREGRGDVLAEQHVVEGEESPLRSKFSKVKSIQGFERKILKESPAPATLHKPRSIKDFIQENEEKMLMARI